MTRDIYAEVNLGIRRINWQRIPLADAGGYVDIADQGEAQDLTDDFSGPGGGIDVFMVQSIGDASGWSKVKGPCDKASKFYLSGAVLELSGGRRFTGMALGHEVGHYLGLEHNGTTTNLMGVDTNDEGLARLTRPAPTSPAARGGPCARTAR